MVLFEIQNLILCLNIVLENNNFVNCEIDKYNFFKMFREYVKR